MHGWPNSDNEKDSYLRTLKGFPGPVRLHPIAARLALLWISSPLKTPCLRHGSLRPLTLNRLTIILS